jgi:hypothetical protein
VWVVLRYFGLTIPWWLRDLIMAYGLVVGARWRSHQYMKAQGFKLHPVFVRVFLWPVYWSRISGLTVTEHRIVHESDEPPPLHTLDPEQLEQHLAAIRSKTIDPKPLLAQYNTLFLLNLLIIVVSVAAFFLWNHLQNVFGPSG